MPQNVFRKQQDQPKTRHLLIITGLSAWKSIQCYVLDLQMVTYQKSSQYFVGSLQISVFYWHFDVRLVFIMIVTVNSFVNFTNKFIGAFFPPIQIRIKMPQIFQGVIFWSCETLFFISSTTNQDVIIIKENRYTCSINVKKCTFGNRRCIFIYSWTGKKILSEFIFWKFCILQFIHRLFFLKEIHRIFQMLYFIVVLIMAFTASIMFLINNSFVTTGFLNFNSVMFLVKILTMQIFLIFPSLCNVNL